MKYRVGFKNGMTITIEADSLYAASYNTIHFVQGGEAPDKNTYVHATEILFVAPADKSQVERGAAAPAVAAK